MFNPFKKQTNQNSQKIVFKIDGMHCVSCSLNIDGELEDTEGVISASTNYARSQSEIEFDPNIVSEDTLKNVIEGLGYTISV